MSKQNIQGMSEENMKEAFTQFQEKWDKMDVNERNGTLLNMVLSLSYRLDILASVVSNLDEVTEMDKVAAASKEEPKTKEKQNGEQKQTSK